MPVDEPAFDKAREVVTHPSGDLGTNIRRHAYFQP